MAQPKSEDDLHDLRVLVEQAARGDDPADRRKMAEVAIRFLEAGDPIPHPVRVWLLFVVRRLLQGKDRIPKFARKRGRRRIDGATPLLHNVDLYLFLDKRVENDFNKPIEIVIAEAEPALGGWVRRHFYSDHFAEWRRRFKRRRRLLLRRAQAKRRKNSR